MLLYHSPAWVFILFFIVSGIYMAIWLYSEYMAIRHKGWGGYWSVSYEYIGSSDEHDGEMDSLMPAKPAQ
jgi:hypothetical protein